MESGVTFQQIKFSGDQAKVLCANIHGMVFGSNSQSGASQYLITPSESKYLNNQIYKASSISWNRDNRRVAISFNDGIGAVHIYDAENWSLLFELKEPGVLYKQVAWSPDGTYLAVVKQFDPIVYIYNQSLREICQIKTHTSPSSIHTGKKGVGAIDWRNDDNTLVIGLDQGRIQFSKVGESFPNDLIDEAEPTASTNLIQKLKSSPNGKFIASVDTESNKVLQLWDVDTRMKKKGIQVFDSMPINFLEWSPDSNKVAMYSRVEKMHQNLPFRFQCP